LNPKEEFHEMLDQNKEIPEEHDRHMNKIFGLLLGFSFNEPGHGPNNYQEILITGYAGLTFICCCH
jgi:hypothetical protein